MRKPSTFSLRTEDDSDAYSTSAPASTQAYLDDNISPQGSYNKESDDSDCFSDSSKKIRKKRNAYSKISDEIRLKLLECVKNGETLKSAAKRFKINYSSAKSILHTFRKEGRILKKSAQERTTKKKSESLFDIDQAPKSTRVMKKNSENLPVEKSARSMSSLNGKGVLSKDTTPAGSLTRLDDLTYGYDYQGHHQRGEEHNMRTSGMQQEVDHHDEAGHHHPYNKMAYYMNYNDGLVNNVPYHHQHHDAGRNYMAPEGLEQVHYGMQYPREYDSFNDMVSALHYKGGQADEFFTDPSANFLHQRDEQGGEYHEHPENGFGYQLKSFMDTQSMFRDALKKGTHAGFSNSANPVGYRKASVDLF